MFLSVIFFKIYLWLLLQGQSPPFKLIYLFLVSPGLHCCARASLTAVNRGHSPLQWAGSSCCGARGSRRAGFSSCGMRAVVPGLSSAGSALVAHRVTCSAARGIFPDQASELYLSCYWQADSLPLSRQGSPRNRPLNPWDLLLRYSVSHFSHLKTF